MMKLATIFKSRGNISGQLLDGAEDVFMGSARFSTVAQKTSTVGQKASTVAQKTWTVGYKGSTAAQKASTVAQEASTVAQKASTVGQEASSFAQNASTVGQTASTFAQKASTVGQEASTFAQKASTVAQKASTGGRIFASFMLYKGKAAFAAEPVAPTFTKNEAGDLFVKRSGYIMLSFSPSIGERKYDWERKQKFAMSVTEVGSLISLGPGGSCDFFHDPGMQTSNAGQVRKSLQIRGNPDGKFYFITLNVVDNVKKLNERFAVQVTPGEFSVIRTSFSFALPHIMGWDRYTNRPPPMKAEYSSYSGRKAEYSLNSDRKAEYSNSPPPMKEFSSEWDR